MIGYAVDLARGTRQSPSVQARRQPARHDGAARRREGVGVAERFRRDHARPHPGDGAARAPAPHPAAPRGRTRGRLGRHHPARLCCSRCRFRSRARRSWPSPVDSSSLLALGVIPIVAHRRSRGCSSPGWGSFVVLAALDLLLAASPRRVTVSRSDLPARVRLGETVRAELILTNLGRRTLRGIVRDAWQPSAGAVADPPRDRGSRRASDARSRRRSPRFVAASAGRLRVTIRAVRPARPRGTPGDHRRGREPSGCSRRSIRESTCRRDWRGCGSWMGARA